MCSFWSLYFKPGDFNAGTDQLDVTFHGIGGHGSPPHLTKDPVLIASAAIVQCQFIVSRAINPLNAAVITVGSVQAGADNNVIPASALLKINLRWYDEKDRQRMLDGIVGSEDFHHLVIDNEKRCYLNMYVGTAKPEDLKKARAEGKQVPYATTRITRLPWTRFRLVRR